MTPVERPRAWLSWSSGKDSAWALQKVRAQGAVEIVGLLTSVNATANRVFMHGVRRALLERGGDDATRGPVSGSLTR